MSSFHAFDAQEDMRTLTAPSLAATTLSSAVKSSATTVRGYSSSRFESIRKPLVIGEPAWHTPCNDATGPHRP
jgi:hypothetical protein